ncbi:MAG: hypothetical protein IH973_12750, partial [Myxococcales bacterium]|nr:hypothetical protein [Myxococcales bacterium]
MELALFALTISGATGWFALEIAWPRPRQVSGSLVLRAAVSGALGLFASSLIYFACLILGLATRPWVIGIDIAVLVALAGYGVSAQRSRPPLDTRHDEPAEPLSAIDWMLGAGLATALVVNGYIWLQRFRDESLGFWDAFAIWNLKARFFFFDAGEHWQRAFSDIIEWSHTDYPLLLPLNVARLWTYAGDADQTISALLSVAFSTLALAILFAAIAQARGRPLAFLGALAVCVAFGLRIARRAERGEPAEAGRRRVQGIRLLALGLLLAVALAGAGGARIAGQEAERALLDRQAAAFEALRAERQMLTAVTVARAAR